jgi:hypothetical protein
MTLFILLVLGVIVSLVIKSILTNGSPDRSHPDADYTPGMIHTPATDDGHYHQSGDFSHHGDSNSPSHDSGSADSTSADSSGHSSH